jgi:hypothetical protein
MSDVAALVNNTVMYRGARMGDPKRIRGPAYFSNNELFAKTYGPVSAFRIRIARPLVVDDEEWFEYSSNAFVPTPQIASRVKAMGYDSVVNVRPILSGDKLVVMLLVDGRSAKAI